MRPNPEAKVLEGVAGAEELAVPLRAVTGRHLAGNVGPGASHARVGGVRDAYAIRQFARAPGGLAPSLLCEGLYAILRGALARIKASLQEIGAFDALRTMRCTLLAMSDIGELYFVPLSLRRFQTAAPNLQVQIVATSGADA